MGIRAVRILAVAAALAPAVASAQTTVSSQAHIGPATHQLRPPGPWAAVFGGGNAERVLDAAAAALDGAFLAGVTFSFGQGVGEAWVARIDAHGRALWERTLGGAATDELSSIAATADGGCVLAGYTSSFGAGGYDGWIVKLAGDGSLQWQSTYGAAGDEFFTRVALVDPGMPGSGYYVGGTADLGATGNDAWLLELDAAGLPVWQRRFAGELNDEVTALASTPQGPVFVANSNSSFGLAIPGVPFFRPWIVALDGDGLPRWQRTLDFSGGDTLQDILPLADGGFALTGELLSMGFFRGDVWVVRLDAAGNLVWDTRLGDNHGVNFVDSGRRIRRTPDGGFMVLGSTGTAGAGSEDLWLLRLDAAGTLIDDRTLGTSGYDGGHALVVTPTGDALVAGFTQAPGLGSLEAFVARLSVGGSTPIGVSCLPPFPTGPLQWTSALLVHSPQVAPTTTSVVPAVSALAQQSLNTGVFVCH